MRYLATILTDWNWNVNNHCPYFGRWPHRSGLLWAGICVGVSASKFQDPTWTMQICIFRIVTSKRPMARSIAKASVSRLQVRPAKSKWRNMILGLRWSALACIGDHATNYNCPCFRGGSEFLSMYLLWADAISTIFAAKKLSPKDVKHVRLVWARTLAIGEVGGISTIQMMNGGMRHVCRISELGIGAAEGFCQLVRCLEHPRAAGGWNNWHHQGEED